MTADHCNFQLARLNILRGVPAEIYEYFGALRDVPDDVFSNAVSHSIRTRQWFPTPAELRADCDAVAPSRIDAPDPQIEEPPFVGREVFLKNPFGDGGITITLGRDWRFDCATCEDTGWAAHHCPERDCGRRFNHPHDPHPYMLKCECATWNPTILRRRAANAKYAQPPEKV